MMSKSNNILSIFGLIATIMLGNSNTVLAQNYAPGSVDTQSSSSFEVSSDICPEPRQALSNSPDDLAQIQEDITRLNLCVQRAQLLERLNSLVLKNIQTIDSAISANLTLEMPEIVIPPITEIEIEGGFVENTTLEISTNTKSEEKKTWKIKDIQGAGKNMEAVLIDDSGAVVRVKQGDKLPDDAGRISSIGVSGVTVNLNNKTQRLQWMN